MASPLRLSGSITALATPFTAAGEVDMDAWRRLVRQQIEAGTRALVVAGSTGEAPALYDVEYDALLHEAVELAASRVPVLAGTGLSNTDKTISRSRRAAGLGADGVLVVTPPYVRPTQAGLLAHFRAVADDSKVPVLLYNVPARTGCDMQPETTAELAKHPRICGIKEARNDPERMQQLLALRSDDFVVLSGDDPTAVRAMLAGADGLVSVASNVLPHAMRLLCRLAHHGHRDEAMALQARLAPCFEFLAVEPNPIPLKALLAEAGIGRGPRLPLTPLSEEHAGALSECAARIQALEQECRAKRAA